MSDNAVPPTQAATPPATSVFSAPAQVQSAPPVAAPLESDMGDTSFLDNVASREPLIKPCQVPGTVMSLSIKDGEKGPSISLAVQLFGDKMVNEEGQPVSSGKRLTTMIFAFSKPEREAIERKGRDLKNLLLALRDVPLSPSSQKTWAAWTAVEKPGMLKLNEDTQRVPWSLHPFQPTDKWTGVKVLVNVTKGKDQDGTPRNEFTLYAASTPQKGAK